MALAATLAARAALAFAAFTWFADAAWLGHLLIDVSRWGHVLEQARRGLVPFVDFGIEYPVGAGLFYWLVGPLLRATDLRHLALTHAAVMAAVDGVTVALFHRLVWAASPRRALGLSLLFSLNLTALVLAPARFDSVAVSFVLLGCLAHRQGRPLRAACWWSLGSLVKWFPALLLAVQELRAYRVEGRRSQWLRSGLVLAGITLLANAPFLLLCWMHKGNLEAWLYSYRFHLRRPLYWDTLLGVLQLWLGPLPWERHAGLWSFALVAATLLLRPALRLEYKATLACLAGLLLNRVYSPQFHLWFYPLLLLGLADEPLPRMRRLLALFASLDVLNVLVYPVAFAHTLLLAPPRPGAALEGGGWLAAFSIAMVLRSLAQLALGAELLRSPAPTGSLRMTID
jgi:hypothetical protein